MQQSIQLQGLRPSVLSRIERTVKNYKQWSSTECNAFGESFTYGEVLRAHAAALFLLALIGIGGAL